MLTGPVGPTGPASKDPAGPAQRQDRLPLPSLFLVLLGTLALLWHPIIFMTDEVAQLAAFDSIVHGHLDVGPDYSAGYEKVKSDVFWHVTVPTLPGGRSAPVGSTMLNVLGLPVYEPLRALGAAIGNPEVLALVAGALVAAGTWAGLRLWGGRLDPRLRAALPAAAGILVAAGGWSTRDYPAEPFLELSALMLVSMVATALGAAFLYDLLHRLRPGRGALVATLLYVFATPVLFWATSSKYTALSTALAALALWAYQDGGRTSPWRTGLAFALCGLAVWNQPPIGLILLATVGLVALGVFRLGWQPALLRIGAGALGLLLGALPYVLQRAIEWKHGLPSHYFPALVPYVGSAAQGIGQGVASETGNLQTSILFDPEGVIGATWQTTIWSGGAKYAPALAFLSVSPFFILAILVLLKPKWLRQVPVRFLAFAGLYALLMFALEGRRLQDVGAGYDMRHSAMWWPLLLPLLLPLVSDWTEGRGTAWLRNWAPASILGIFAAALLATLVVHTVDGAYNALGREYESLFLFRWVGPVIGLLLLIAYLWIGDAATRPRDLWIRFWDRTLLVAAGMGVAFNVMAKLGTQNLQVDAVTSPFAFWLTDLLGRGVWWAITMGL